jgi:hypothetical protein
MSTVQFVIAVGAIVIAAVAPTITLAVYLSSRIDRVLDHQMELGERVTKLEVTTAEGFGRVERALQEHAATHARLAHGRPQ